MYSGTKTFMPQQLHLIDRTCPNRIRESVYSSRHKVHITTYRKHTSSAQNSNNMCASARRIGVYCVCACLTRTLYNHQRLSREIHVMYVTHKNKRPFHVWCLLYKFAWRFYNSKITLKASLYTIYTQAFIFPLY